MTTPSKEKRQLTPNQVADRLGVSRKTVINWIRKGQLKAKDFGTGRQKRYKVHVDQVEAFEQSREVQPEEPAAPLPRRRRRKFADGPY